MYGTRSLRDIENQLTAQYPEIDFTFAQSNHEGGLIDCLHAAAAESIDGVVMNPGGYSHTSISLRDAVSAVRLPTIEVHLSNLHAREPFRHPSVTGGACIGSIAGLGVLGYDLAVRYLVATIDRREDGSAGQR